MEKFFQLSYKDNVRGPFCAWTENASGGGAAQFLTGAGGFLASLPASFAGLRRRTINELELNAMLPSSIANSVTFRGVALGHVKLTIEVKRDQLRVCVRFGSISILPQRINVDDGDCSQWLTGAMTIKI